MVRRAVAENPNTMDSTLYRIYTEDKDMYAMSLAGANIHAVHRFEFDFNSFYWGQLEGYAKNPNISEKEMFRILNLITYKDKCRVEAIFHNLAGNTSVTENIIERIIEMIDEEDFSNYGVRGILRNILNNSKVCNEEFFKQII